MFSRFQGGFLDGLVCDVAHHTRNGAAPDYLRVEITGEGPHGTELFEYSLMKLNAKPDPADGAVAIYLCPVDSTSQSGDPSHPIEAAVGSRDEQQVSGGSFGWNRTRAAGVQSFNGSLRAAVGGGWRRLWFQCRSGFRSRDADRPFRS